MRVAILTDTHGNAFALEAVLKDLHTTNPDLIINLGDQVEGHANPAHAAELQANLNAIEVRGNNEEKWWPGGRRTPLSQQIGTWLETQLTPQTREHLAALPLTAQVGGILACHGTPESTWHSLLWEWKHGTTQTNGYYHSRDPRELQQLTEPLHAEVIVCGHTHRPGATRIGNTLIVNSGAVSDQVDGDPRARWTLLEQRHGHWTVDFRTVPYDIEAAITWAIQHSPFGEFGAELLRSGQMTGRGQSSL